MILGHHRIAAAASSSRGPPQVICDLVCDENPLLFGVLPLLLDSQSKTPEDKFFDLHGNSEFDCHAHTVSPIVIDPEVVPKLPRLILFVFHDTTTTSDDRRRQRARPPPPTTTPRPTKDHDDNDDDDETRLSAIDLDVGGSQDGPRKA